MQIKIGTKCHIYVRSKIKKPRELVIACHDSVVLHTVSFCILYLVHLVSYFQHVEESIGDEAGTKREVIYMYFQCLAISQPTYKSI